MERVPLGLPVYGKAHTRLPTLPPALKLHIPPVTKHTDPAKNFIEAVKFGWLWGGPPAVGRVFGNFHVWLKKPAEKSWPDADPAQPLHAHGTV
eukprot:scaffold271924_cov14-Tisochrysis_lutea.AAC.1